MILRAGPLAVMLYFWPPLVLGPPVYEEGEEEPFDVKRIRCKPAKRPLEYEPIDRMAPSVIKNCGTIKIRDIFQMDLETVDISVLSFSENNKVVLIAQRKSPLYLLNIVTEGDSANWDLMTGGMRSFRGHSCKNAEKFCDLTSLKLVEHGFWTVDRHRVMMFNFTWTAKSVEEQVYSIGRFNHIDLKQREACKSGQTASCMKVDVLHPYGIALYEPLNRTHIDANTFITPMHQGAGNQFLFVADTGNHRILVLNMSSGVQDDVVAQFGVTGLPLNTSSGLNWPHGVATVAPAVEASFEGVFVNVYVADRRNNRVVKLKLGPALHPSPLPHRTLVLAYSGHYGGLGSDVPNNESLADPIAVATYRHYIVVTEGIGNSITFLKAHHSQFKQLIFVTRLTPVSGIQLTGHIAVSPMGYVWYTYVMLPARNAIGSIFLDEVLRESPPRETVEDVTRICQNDTWYHTDLLHNRSLYLEKIGWMFNATKINWLWPELPGLTNIFKFNLSYAFDLPALNSTVFSGRLRICDPPPPSTTPAMLSGGADGWTGSSNKRFRAGAIGSRPRHCVFRFVSLSLLAAGIW